MSKDNLIVAQNSNTATAHIIAACISSGAMTYEQARASWTDMHSIVYGNTLTAAATQTVAAVIPGVQAMPTPPPPPAPPQAAPVAPSAPASGGRGGWIREDAFATITNAIEFERQSGITFGSTQSNFYCNQTVKASGYFPNGNAVKNVATYPDAKVKPSGLLGGDWGPSLQEYADHAIDFGKLPSSFTRPPVYVK